MQNIRKNAVVTLHYQMFGPDETLLDKTEEPISYLHGGYDGIFPLVEEQLQDKAVGDAIDITLLPDDAFGEREEALVRNEPRDAFPDHIELGMVFETDDPATGEVMLFTVIQINKEEVTLDGNHPLAGQNIRFVANIVGIREATEEEISHGHAHGAHGHSEH